LRHGLLDPVKRVALVVALAACQKPPPPPAAPASGGEYTVRPILPDLDTQQIAALVEQTLTGLGGRRASVTFVRDESHLYRVSYKLGEEAPKELWISKDGHYIAHEVTDVLLIREQVARDRRFVDCLDGAGVRLFLDASAGSAAVLRDVGIGADRLAVWCEVPDSGCPKLGVKKLPSARVGAGPVYEGGISRAWLETQTGCK
jgi:hypothetical protein